jgi:hypothetical protein
VSQWREQCGDVRMPRSFIHLWVVPKTLTRSKRSLVWVYVDNYRGQRELFSVHSGPQNSAINVQGIVSVFILFFSRSIVHKIVVETNRYADNL